jgi:hypothetical protein
VVVINAVPHLPGWLRPARDGQSALPAEMPLT